MTGNPNSRLRHPLAWLLPILLIALAALVLPSVAHAQSTAPTVSSVAITSTPGTDNTYVTGDTITVSLAFSEAVTVTGAPHVVVDIGGQPRNFSYSGDGSSAAAQPFSYTALVGDLDTDGVAVLLDSLTLNDGTIQATDDSAAATLAHSAMTFATHKVDTQVTLMSNLGQADAPNEITISATESFPATIRVVAEKSFDINAITLDVTTPSDTLDVTVKLVDKNSPLYLNYTYTGSVTTAGLQTFTLSEPSEMKFGNVGLPPGRLGGGFTGYQVEIHGSDAGSIQLAGTTSETSDSGAVSGISFPGALDVLKPQMRLSGHEGLIPNLIYGDVVSSPPNGSAYAAGDRIDLLFVFSQNVDIQDGHVIPIWLGTGAEHRREARLDTGIFIDYTYLIFSYTVQAGDTDTDGIYIGADPLGDNAGFDLHASYSSSIPADVRLAANQLPASQSVDGSSSRTCEEVLCSTVRSGVSADDRFPGFSTLNRASNFPFLTLGASSAWSFEYRGEWDAVVEVVLDHNVDSLDLLFLDGLSASRYNRLALSVDGEVFLLSEANDKGSYGEVFQWLYPGLTWAEGDDIDVKLIETATATFDAASYAKAEGDTFNVTVTLGDSFVNTLTLPIVVAGNGGADATDHIGIPENLVFAPGDTEKTFTVTIVDDELDDDGESLTLSFDDPHIRSGGANETAAITIIQNLVSNTGQGGNSDDRFAGTGDHGQAFTTGDNLPGYNITGVTIISEDPEGDDMALQICEVAGNGWPTTTCTDLTSAGPFAAGPLLFNVPTGTTLTLEAHTTYMVVFKSPGGEQVIVDATDSDDNDDTSLPDWEIRNKSQYKDSNVWRDRGYDRAIAIAIGGTVNKTFINDNVTFTPDSFTRTINENTGANRNVGAPVTATYTGTCTLIHRLGGTDADSFGIDSSTGQIRTRSGVTYDHEARPSYTITVTAYHSNCGTDDATVTINVNDVNEPPRVPLEVVAYPVPRTFDQLFVRWTPPGNAGRPDITGYDIQYEFGDNGIWNNGPQNVAGTSGIISRLEDGTFYDVRVRAKNDEGSGPWSGQYEALTNVLDFEVEVPSTIVPDGLVPGDRFRLLLVTQPVQATKTDMSEYREDAWTAVVQALGINETGEYFELFSPVASTRYIDARVITNTTYTNEDKGVPIYWVGGAKAADDYEDFYDGDWDDESARNARGELVPLPDGVWTGSAADGTEFMESGTSRALGQSPAGYGAPGSSVSGEGPIHSGSTAANTARKPIFGLSSVFRIVHPPLVANIDQTGDTDDRRSAMRAQAFTTGANRHGYGFSGVSVGKHYTETSHIEVSVYSVDASGHPDTQLFALSNPDSYTNDTQAFNAPAGSTLDPGTPYALVVQHATSGADLTLYTTASDSEDDESLDGWSIANAFHYENGGSWQAEPDGKALRIIVRGIAKAGPSLAPTELTATAVGDNRIDLSWTAPTDDGGSIITGYRIESSADGSTGWTDLVADTRMTATTHSHTGLMPNTTRHYRVSAINGEGTSEPSDTANATTDYPEVTVQFDSGPYTVAEGGAQTVTVVLSGDPFRTTVIPLMATGRNGAQSGDYTVPPSVTFSTGQTYAPFTFTATQDDVDDDDESVRLTFGPNLPSKVSVGTMDETTVSITDDDDPRVEVSFSSGTYIVPEGGTQQVTVTLSADPERQVVILITATPQGGAVEDDYSGVPDNVTFNSGQKSKSFTFSATDDTQDEDGEKVLLTFGTLPTRVTAGATGQTTISISDDCADVDIWCATMAFGATVHWVGRYDLQATDVDNREFSHNGADYQLWSTEMEQNGHDSGDDNQVVPPFGIPERTHFLIDFLNLSGPIDQVFDPPNNDWLDWALHVGTISDGETLTATLRFSEARKLAGAWWRWSGGDIDGLRRAWKTDQLYKLRLVEDPRSERTPQPLNPPLYLSVQGEVNTTQTWLRWLTPQTRHDRVPPVDSYRIQWKHSSGSWDTSADVSETTRGPSRQRPVSHHLDGLTPGVEYNIRVIATDSVGDSEPSNEVTYTKPATGQQSLSNTPAEGEPRIDGIPEVGQTLSADTTGIADADGLEEVVFQYQWLADDADIASATDATYNVVSGDVGKSIRVRVSFTDDGGNEETLTSAPIVVTAAGLQLRSATVDGGILTLTYSEVLDNGVTLGTAPFAVNVNGSSRSLSGVAVGRSNVLLFLSQAVEAGDTVTVDYTAPDGQDFIRDTLGRKAASFSRQAVTNDTAADQEDTARGQEDTDTAPEHASAVVEPPLTATIHDAPSSHDGSAAFTFQLEFSEEPDFSYRTLRDHGFTVTGGSVTYVRRLDPPSNIGWEIHVTPDGNGDVNLSLRSTTDCSAQGAICTGDGRMLSGGLQLAVAGPNTPATGAPTISGTAQVGETLTADTTGIADEDGLDNATFAYQWLAAGAEISGATAPAHTLVDDAEGKAITVRVRFTDDRGNDETLASAATEAVQPKPNSPATGAPTISGTAQVGETLTAGTSGIFDADGMTGATFSYQWAADDAEISGATASAHTLVDADEDKAVKVQVSFTDDRGNEETLTSAATEAVQPKPNSPATGAPTISGTAQVGETLTAGTSGIFDADGMTSATFSYQWVADDAEISGATASAHTLVDADEDKAVKVQVSFTDDRGNEETLTSAATEAVQPKPNNPATGAPTISGTAQVGETLTSSTTDISDGDGLTSATFSYQWLADDAEINGAIASSYTLADDDAGQAIRVQVSFTDDRGHDEGLTSAATEAVQPRPNSPVIRGTARVGETLTADTSEIYDPDGLQNAVFAYRWIAGGADIEGATGSSYRAAAEDEGLIIRVWVSFTDDAGNQETRTSDGTEPVQPLPNTPATGTPTITGTARVGETLTVDTSGISDAEGRDNAVFAYRWIAGGADIEGATGSSYRAAAEDEGLIIRVWVSFTDDAGNQETRTSDGTEPVQPLPNTPATGTPTITGTARVGETLTVDTSGISDAEGRDNAVFTYQWIAGGADIEGATGSSYRAAAEDEGLIIRVWVSFTDDAGNYEALTSQATAAVAEAEPTGPPPAPRNLTATVNPDGSIILSWEAPGDDSITGYQVLRRRPTEGEDTLMVYVADTQSAATTYTDTNGTAGVRHVYRVQAINAAGAGPVSNFVNVTP